MFDPPINPAWLRAFQRTFELSGVGPGEAVAIVSENQSRRINVVLAELALAAIGARSFGIVLRTPGQTAPVPVRSTGASHAIDGLQPVLAALTATTFIADLTVEGLINAPELRTILQSGTRLLYISNEHPEILERVMPDLEVRKAALAGTAALRSSKTMRVTSAAGTDLTINVSGAPGGGGAGSATLPEPLTLGQAE